jgi:TolB protein
MRPIVGVITLCAALLAAGCSAPTAANLSPAQLLQIRSTLAGRLLFVKEGNVWLWTEGRARQLTTGDTWMHPQWSPDGTEIAYVYRGANFSDIFVMSGDGSNSRRLTRGQSASITDNDWTFRPTWSPSGGQIAFVSDKNSYNTAVWMMNRDGTAAQQLLPINEAHQADDALSWSPDGKQIAVASFGKEVSQIALLDPVRRTLRTLTEQPRGALDPAWSPDGKAIAYAARESTAMDIRVRLLDEEVDQPVVKGGLARAPTWSPDSRHLAYISSRDGSFEIYVVDIITESGKPVAANERQLTFGLNVDAPSGLSWSR